jgi:hypothetical protein
LLQKQLDKHQTTILQKLQQQQINASYDNQLKKQPVPKTEQQKTPKKNIKLPFLSA